MLQNLASLTDDSRGMIYEHHKVCCKLIHAFTIVNYDRKMFMVLASEVGNIVTDTFCTITNEYSGNPYWKGWLSTVDLLLLANLH
jgi:hypothetical protein